MVRFSQLDFYIQRLRDQKGGRAEGQRPIRPKAKDPVRLYNL